MLTVVAVISVFSIVVVIHEMGHFLVCKALGVRVERFALGFGKELFGFDWVGTRWSICLLPLGGYVKPAGEDIEETTGAPDEFFGQSWYRRIAIAIAGPIMNYLLAIFCFFVLMFFWGQPKPSSEPVIGEVVMGYPAQAAGLKANDRLLVINGTHIKTWEDMAKEIHAYPEKPIDIRYRRQVEGGVVEKIIALVPKMDTSRNIGLIGISPTVDMVPQGFMDSWKIAGKQTWFWTVFTLKYLGDAIVNRKKPELAGPIGIISIVAKVAKQGFQELLSLIALISLSLGLFNCFPIPLLDGGHIFLYLLEGIFRRPLNKTVVRTANIIGATLLIAVFIFATTQDIARLSSSFWK